MKILNSFSAANKVLTEFRKQIKNAAIRHDIEEITISAYKNGRENGYRLHIYFNDDKGGVEVAFSEGRACDSTVVYVGDFDYASVPTEDTYQNRVMFAFGKEAAAAKFIIKAIA